ncbi:MAG: excinuclease ABC subunit UvrA, partial [Chitinophagaceae bacterium]|nr:excinuclease ABC subunit UvrA [Chitinophagaceae bacterium]
MAKAKQNGSLAPGSSVPDADYIEVFGARVHNLKNIDIRIPKNRLVVITGISGSGKSSLAFDTIYAEGQRRYMETFGAYARQFIGDMERPDVDKITGLSPVISIEQKTTNKNPRSTVGTVTEVYDFLRLLFARAGEAYSYNTGKRMVKWSEEEIVENIFKRFSGQKILMLAPLIRGRKGHYRELFEDMRKKGFLKVRIDGETKDLVPKMQVDRYKIHDIELVVDRLHVTDEFKVRISQSVQQALRLGKDLLLISPVTPAGTKGSAADAAYAKTLMCEDTGISYEEPSPNSFSFNSPYGACPVCKGLGSVYQVNMSEVIPDDSLSINEGAIAPLGVEREAFVFRQVQQLAKKNKFSLDKPIKDLPEKVMNLLMYGDEAGTVEMNLNFDGVETNGQVYTTEFEGIVNQLKRWFAGSSSDSVQQWTEKFMILKPCASCNGARLKKESLWFKIDQKNISELGEMSLTALMQWFDAIEKRLSPRQRIIAKDVIKEIRERLSFLLDVGLSYLTLNRPSRTLSGGESQRIRLATQIGSQLQGITYILDEPSIGLHQRDNHRLITALQNLRDIGNSVLVVEHDKDIMMAADYLVDIGPRAGYHGGRIVSQGSPKEVMEHETLTTSYLNGHKHIDIPAERRNGNGKYLELKGARGNNLKNVNVVFPLGRFIVVTGVSGSGKSTLINETLYPILSKHAYGSRIQPLEYKAVKGLEYVDKVIEIDQSP